MPPKTCYSWQLLWGQGDAVPPREEGIHRQDTGVLRPVRWQNRGARALHPNCSDVSPFVAGVGSMSYAKFGLYNIVGAILWTVICTGAGFGFGNVPAVHENFSLVVLGIVVVSVLPIVFELLAAKRKGGKGGRNGVPGSVKLEGGRLGIDFRGSA